MATLSSTCRPTTTISDPEVSVMKEAVHGGSTIIDHIKMSRENRDEVSETMYFDSQL
jgi:hypothetical protein